MHLTPQNALILTGASHGIGRALALQLAALHCPLVLNARNEAALATVAQMCRESHSGIVAVPGDISHAATARALAEQAQGLSPQLGGFIHAAGVLAPGPAIWELSPEHFQQVLGASLTGSFALIQACVPLLRQKGQGLAVFFGSGAAEKTQPGIAAYCAAKAGEEHLARQLAAEAPELSVLVYRPGIVDTQMQTEARHAHGHSASALRRVFVPWKEQDQLITPEHSAQGLCHILQAKTPLEGQTLDVRSL
ncbi:MAG: SDR family NAD(P)-dependent oxidoreductase [Thermodesulfobacteriota bacterium]